MVVFVCLCVIVCVRCENVLVWFVCDLMCAAVRLFLFSVCVVLCDLV